MRNFFAALMLAIAYDGFQLIGEVSVVALVGLAIVPFLPFLQIIVSAILYYWTGSIWVLAVFFPEEIPVLNILPLNTVAVILANNGSLTQRTHHSDPKGSWHLTAYTTHRGQQVGHSEKQHRLLEARHLDHTDIMTNSSTGQTKRVRKTYE